MSDDEDHISKSHTEYLSPFNSIVLRYCCAFFHDFMGMFLLPVFRMQTCQISTARGQHCDHAFFLCMCTSGLFRDAFFLCGRYDCFCFFVSVHCMSTSQRSEALGRIPCCSDSDAFFLQVDVFFCANRQCHFGRAGCGQGHCSSSGQHTSCNAFFVCNSIFFWERGLVVNLHSPCSTRSIARVHASDALSFFWHGASGRIRNRFEPLW